jgi:hypothetical protein
MDFDVRYVYRQGAVAVTLTTLDRNRILGSLEIGVLVSLLLLGIATSQAYYYYSRFPTDGRTTKWLVGLVMLLEYGHVVAVCYALYGYTVTGFDDPSTLLDLPPSAAVSIVLAFTVISLVHTFFANRIRVLSRRLIIPLISWVISFLQFLTSLVTTVQLVNPPDTLHSKALIKKYGWVSDTGLALVAANGILIAGSTSWYLWCEKEERRECESTTRILDKLVAWTLETGTITSLGAIVTLVCVSEIVVIDLYSCLTAL